AEPAGERDRGWFEILVGGGRRSGGGRCRQRPLLGTQAPPDESRPVTATGGRAETPQHRRGHALMHLIDGYYVAPGVVLTGDVVCGPGVNIWYGTVIRGDLSRITLGPRVNIQDGCIIHTDEGYPLEVEEGVVV